MSRRRRVKDKKIEQYEHPDAERVNNPPVGLVTSDLDPVGEKKEYPYDPHLDPQLIWAGKAEYTSFEVDTVSLHVHERIDPKTIIQAVRKNKPRQQGLVSFFASSEENPPLRDAIEFYHHKHGWSNRLIAGDSLLMMNSLLEKEGMAGTVQMIYIDPPYGIKYQSNFQPFINKRDVTDGKDEDLTQEPEMIKAFRDTWELGIHSYLGYLRDRVLLAKELLSETGNIFIQIGDENVHLVRIILDEIFGRENFVNIITFRKTGGFSSSSLDSVSDFLLWYCKDINKVKINKIYVNKQGKNRPSIYNWLMLNDNTFRRMTKTERDDVTTIPKDAKIVAMDNFSSMGLAKKPQPYVFKGKTYNPSRNSHWKSKYPEGLDILATKNRLYPIGNSLMYVRFLDDFPVMTIDNIWNDTSAGGFSGRKVYVVQTNVKILERCIFLTTDPGDLVIDPTCGSGTTAFVAERWGRRWITCDTSRVAIVLAKQRLLTAFYDYYVLKHPKEGVQGNFSYRTVPHITLKSIANDEPHETIELNDQPLIDSSKVRVTGPFTVEAVPAPYVKSIGEIKQIQEADSSVTRDGETLRQSEWRSELLKTGIKARNGQKMTFTRVEALSGTHWLHADAETKEDEPKRAVISFGPEFAPLGQRQVELAIEEAQRLVPRPKLIIFASFQFDPEASKDVDETDWPGVTLVKVQMNADLLTDDLKKERASNESFWLIGQPDVKIKKLQESEFQVEVLGFDYYNPITGEIESGGTEKIAMWMLDTDYNYRSLFPRQVFFPMSGSREGWNRLARNLKSEIDEELIEKYQGTVSLPFSLGMNESIAIKIVDDRGIESLKIIKVD